MSNKNNLKWCVQLLVLLAIICYGAGLSLKRHDGTATPNILPESLVDAFVAYPEGIGYMVINRHKVEYWEDVFRVFQEREKTEPTIIGTILLKAEEKWTEIKVPSGIQMY